MNENLNEALDQIQDKHIAEAIRPKKRKGLLWLTPVAAILALVLVLTALPHAGQPAQPGQSALVGVAQLVQAAEYPEMAPYPGEEAAWTDSQEYTAWRQGIADQYDQPEGYEEGLGSFFAESIPLLLADSDENAVCSPLNIYMALAMLAQVTDGTSREAVLDALGSNTLEDLQIQAGHVWNAHYRSDGTAACLLANSLWLDRDRDYEAQTVESLTQNFYASVYRGDFEDPGMTASLREWLSQQTQGLLDDYVNQVEFPQASALTLASTVYFRDKWAGTFRAENNTEGLFYGPGLPQICTYLNKTMSYGPYYAGPDYGAVCLETEAGYKLWLFLPDAGSDPNDLLASGYALDLALDPKIEDQISVRVNLSLPKFDISGQTDLAGALTGLGLGDLFDPEAADFSAILPDAQGVALGQASHAARVAIDEEGITAAAYTILQAAGAPMPPEEEIDFVLDRPFLFILTSQDDLPLFAGIVNEP